MVNNFSIMTRQYIWTACPESSKIAHWLILNIRRVRLRPISFHDARHTFHADTCDPLKNAAEAGLVRFDAVAHGTYPGRHLPRGVLPELCSAGYWDAPADQAWGLAWHRNEGIELTYLARGRLSFAVDDRAYALRRGHMTITRPWQLHRVGDPNVDASRLIWLILDVKVRRPNQRWQWPDWLILSRAEQRQLSTLLRHNEQGVWTADRSVADAFEQLGQVVSSSHGARSVDRTRLALCINQLLLSVMRMLHGKSIPLDEALSSSHRSVEMFLAELPRRLDQPWTVDAMADQCGLARSRFTHYCRQITNLSPIDYLTRCRVECATDLLKTRPDLSITQIAMTCGFSSSQYFATVFRHATGSTPRELRTLPP